MISSKKLGRMVTADVDRALANIDADTAKPDMKSGNEDLAKAVAPKKVETFAEAFRAARARGDKTFSWAGKPGMKFTTEMAGQGAKRSAATSAPTRRTTEASKPAADVSEGTKKFMSRLPFKPKAETPAAPKTEAKRDNTAAGRRARMASAISGFFGGSDESRARYAAQQKKAAETRAARKPLLLTGEEARKANKGTIGGMRKGGKIDGCAVRGKTRAMRKGK